MNEKLKELLEDATVAEEHAWTRLSEAVREAEAARERYFAARVQRITAENVARREATTGSAK